MDSMLRKREYAAMGKEKVGSMLRKREYTTTTVPTAVQTTTPQLSHGGIRNVYTNKHAQNEQNVQNVINEQ